MQIKPYSSFTTESNASNFPALKILFHADDYVLGSTTWESRYGSLILTLQTGATKDSNGVYTTVTNSITAVSGPMPTLSKYIVSLTIGKLQTSSGTAGLATTFGVASPGPSITSTGVAVDNGASPLNTIPSLTGTISNGSSACAAAYFDLVDTTSPAIFRVLAGATSGDQAIPNGAGTTTSTGQIVLGAALAPGFTVAGLAANNDGRRTKIIALFDFASPMVIGDVEVAATEMARTQELFAGWRNRAAA